MALRLDGNDVASVNSQDVRCTGLVDFSMEYVDRTCSVVAWVTPALQDSIVIGSQTMLDLEFASLEDTPAEEVR